MSNETTDKKSLTELWDAVYHSYSDAGLRQSSEITWRDAVHEASGENALEALKHLRKAAIYTPPNSNIESIVTAEMVALFEEHSEQLPAKLNDAWAQAKTESNTASEKQTAALSIVRRKDNFEVFDI